MSPWLIVPFLAVLLATLPWLVCAQLPQTSDASYHLLYLRNFADGWQQGILYPRWAADCNGGLGAPVFVFYPPLSPALGAAFFLMLGDALEALRWSGICGFGVAAVSYYLSVRRLYGERAAALGAGLYTLLPYHLFDLYDRGAMAEFLGLIWLPVLFSLLDREQFSWLGLTLALAALIFTHPMLALMSVLAWPAWALGRRSWVKKHWPGLVAALGLALALSAVYWLPMLAESNHVQMDSHFSQDHYYWRRNLLYDNEAERNYTVDRCKPWATLAATTTLFLTLSGLALGTRKGRPWAALSLVSFLMQTPLSVLLWQLWPFLDKLQFPWRFGALQMLGCCLLWSALLHERPGHRAAFCLLGLSLPALLGAGVTALWARPYQLDETLAESPAYRQRSLLEYTPTLKQAANWRGDMQAWCEVPCQAQIQQWQPQFRRLSLSLDQPGSVWLRTLRYPGWQARLDGENQPLLPGPFLAVRVSPGRHQLDFLFRATSLRRGALVISQAAMGVWFALAVWVRLRRPQ